MPIQEEMERRLEGGDTESAIDVMRRMEAERSTVGEPVASVAAREMALRERQPLQPWDNPAAVPQPVAAAPAAPPTGAGPGVSPQLMEAIQATEGVPTYKEEMARTEEVDVILPSGEEVTIIIPEGMPDDLIETRLKAAGELPPDPSTEKQPLQAALQGALIGTADEVAATLAAGTAKVVGAEDSFADIYNDVLESERDKLAEYRKEYPKEAFAYEMLGAVTPAVISGGTGAPVTTGRLAGTGAAWGAGYGAGMADPSPELSAAESVQERAKGAGSGAAVGAVGGAAIGAATKAIPKAVKKSRVKKARTTREGANKLQKDYQKIVINEKMMGATGADAHAAARKALGMKTDDTYHMTRMSDEELFTPGTAEQAAEYAVANNLWKSGIRSLGIMRPIDRIIRPIYDRIEEHVPYLAQQLRNYEGKVYLDVHNWHERAKPYIAVVRNGMSAGERRELDKLLYNGKVPEARAAIVAKLGEPAGKHFDNMRSLLNDISKAMEDKGAVFSKVERGWFPRRIKDIEKLKNKLGTKYLQGFEAYAERIGNEQAAINAFMRADPGTRVKETALRRRKVTEVNDELIDFYHDHIGSMDLFFREAAQHINRRDLFKGHVKVNQHGVEEIEKSIKSLVGTMKDLTPSDANEVMTLLKIRFTRGEEGMSTGMANIRAVAHNALLANVISAATQLGDIGVSAWLNGGFRSLKAVVGKNQITADDLGIMRELVQEISDPGSINAWTDRLFRYSGFRAVDRLGKNTFINSAFDNYTRMARSYKGRKRLTEELTPYWGVETPQLVKELQEGKPTDLVKTFLFSKLSESQPISRSEVPELFLAMPNGRLFYQLTTWTIKQMNLVRNKIVRQLMSGTPKEKAVALKDAGRMILFVGGANLTSDELKRFMSGKHSTFHDIPEDEMAAAVGAKLLAHTFKNFLGDEDPARGLTSAAEITIPTVDIVGKVTQDAIKYGQKVGYQKDLDLEGEEFKELSREVISKMPLFGKLYAMWFLGGAEKFNEKQAEERKAEFKKRMSQ